MRTFVLSLAVAWLLASTTIAGEAGRTPAACSEVEACGSAHHCGRCGCTAACEKHCHVVCEMKEVKKHVWVVTCGESCPTLPNCGQRCCGDCEACKSGKPCPQANYCDGNGKTCDPCAAEESKCFIPPKCGKVREKKTLEKKEVTCKVPSYKCVVVYCCPKCGAAEDCGEKAVPANSPALPPAPTQGKTALSQPPVAHYFSN